MRLDETTTDSTDCSCACAAVVSISARTAVLLDKARRRFAQPESFMPKNMCLFPL